MFYVFILQYKNVQNNSKILLKCAETSMIPNILYSAVFSIMSVLYCYLFLLFTQLNQVPEDYYLNTRQIWQKIIGIPLL